MKMSAYSRPLGAGSGDADAISQLSRISLFDRPLGVGHGLFGEDKE